MKIFTTAIASLFLASGLAFADHHKKPVNLEGVWNTVAGSDEGERKFTVTVAREGTAYTGTSHSIENGKDRKIDRISVKQKKVTLEFDMERDGEKRLIKVIADEKAPGKLVGKWSVEGSDGTVHMTGPWRADKEVIFSLGGEWDSVGTTGEGEKHSSTMTISGSGAGLKGKFAGEAGDLKIDTVRLNKENLHLAFVLDLDGTKVPTTIEAKATDDNTLEGKWIIKNEANEVAATGDWTAKRNAKPAFVLAGDWDIVATLPEGDEYNGTLSIQKKGKRFSGSSKSDEGEARELKSITFDGKNLVYTVGVELNDQDGIITVTGVKEGDDGFKGRWSLAGPDKKEIAGNSWQATREK